jgi:hypothetical protein
MMIGREKGIRRAAMVTGGLAIASLIGTSVVGATAYATHRETETTTASSSTTTSGSGNTTSQSTPSLTSGTGSGQATSGGS